MDNRTRLFEIKKLKEPILIKIVEWAHKHGKRLEFLTRREVTEAIKCKM